MRLTGNKGLLFSFTMCKIDVDARFFDDISGVEGSGRSRNRRLGRVLFGCPKDRRHALGNPRIGPVVIGSPPSPFIKESRKLVIRVPGSKNRSVIFLMSVLRSPDDRKRETISNRRQL